MRTHICVSLCGYILCMCTHIVYNFCLVMRGEQDSKIKTDQGEQFETYVLFAGVNFQNQHLGPIIFFSLISRRESFLSAPKAFPELVNKLVSKIKFKTIKAIIHIISLITKTSIQNSNCYLKQGLAQNRWRQPFFPGDYFPFKIVLNCVLRGCFYGNTDSVW